MTVSFIALLGDNGRCSFGSLTVDGKVYAAIATAPFTRSDPPSLKDLSFWLILIGLQVFHEPGPEDNSLSYWYFKSAPLDNASPSLDACLKSWQSLRPLPLIQIISCTSEDSKTLAIVVRFGFGTHADGCSLTLKLKPYQPSESPCFEPLYSTDIHPEDDKIVINLNSSGDDEFVSVTGCLEIYSNNSGGMTATRSNFGIELKHLVVPFDGNLLELSFAKADTSLLKQQLISFDWSMQKISTQGNSAFKAALTGFAPKLDVLTDIPLEAALCKPSNIDLFISDQGEPILAATLDLSLSPSSQSPASSPQDSANRGFLASACLEWNMQSGSLTNHRVTFTCRSDNLLDLHVLAICFPAELELTCDFSTPELFFSKGNISILVPGEISAKLPSKSEKKKRFLFTVKQSPPPQAETPILRIKPSGISFYAELAPSEVLIDSDYSLQPVPQRAGVKSAIELQDSHVCQASFFAMMPVPGFDKADVKLSASMALRQSPQSKGLSVHAELELERKSEEPLGELSFGGLRAALTKSTFLLDWTSSTSDKDGCWLFSAKADGHLQLKEPLPPVFSGLDKDRPISFTDLSLKEWTSKISLNLSQDSTLDIFDGLFTARWSGVSLTLENGNGDSRLSKVVCNNASFVFNKKAAFDIEIFSGALAFEFNDKMSPTLRFGDGEPLRIKVRIGDNIEVAGDALMTDSASEYGIGVAGHIEIKGLPAIAALMFIGLGRKNSGETVPNICLYAATDLDIQLYPGVYLKSVGLGIGINRGLSAVGLNPSPLQLLDRINNLDPGRLESWEFVPEGGTYLSLIGTLTIAAVAGDKPSPFVLWMLLCLDNSGVFTAAGKLWLASGVAYTRNHTDRPAVVASMVVIPQKRLLQLYGTTRPNPAIEKDAGLAKILNNCRVKFSYIMSPSLLDYYLEEASFSTNLFGANAQLRGSYRIAITENGVFMRARLIANAQMNRKLSGGSCGASFEAHLRLAIDLLGLIDGDGAVAYAKVEAHVFAKASLWVRIKIPLIGSKTLTKSACLNMNLAGILAFDATGDTGFVGSADAFFCLGGFKAKVAGSLAINEGMVRATESRIVAFERRVNKIRQRATSASDPQLTDSSPTSHPWKIFWSQVTINNKQYLQLVVVPTGAAEWFGTFKPASADGAPAWDWDGLDKITLQLNDDDSPLCWEIGAYALALSKQPDFAALSQFDQLLLQSCQSAATDSDRSDPHWLDAFLIQDPRLQSGMKSWWREEDQIRLQPGVHPIDTRPIEELEAAGLADANFEAVLRFEQYCRRSRRIARHGLNTIDIEAQHRQVARGWVVSHLLDQLVIANGQQRNFPALFCLPWPSTSSTSESLIAKTASVTITRKHGSPLSFEAPLTSTFDLCGLELCTPRQRTVLSPNPADPGKLIGYQQVHLPIRFNPGDSSLPNAEQLIGSFLRSIRGLRLLRRLPGEPEPTVIAEELQIPFRSLSLPVEPGAASPPDAVPLVNNYLILLPSIYNDTFPFQDFDADSGHSLEFAHPLQTTGQSPLPVDRFPIIEYFLEPIPHTPVLRAPRLRFPPIPLQPIEPDPPLHDLVVLLPIPKCCLSSEPGDQSESLPIDLSQFRLARGQHQPSDQDQVLTYQILSAQDPPLLLSESFELELWAEELPGLPSGFYDRLGEPAADVIPSKVDELALQQPKQSTEFKFLVGVFKAAQQQPGSQPLPLSLPQEEAALACKFVPNCRYRFFLRRVKCVPRLGGLLTPVTFAYTKSLPNARIESSELNFSPCFELPQAQHALLQPAVFTVSHDKAEERNRLVFEFSARPLAPQPDSTSENSFSPLAAVEITVQDYDEPQRLFTLERELLQVNDFLVDERDFRNSSIWEVAGTVCLSPLPAQSAPQNTPNNPWYDEALNTERSKLVAEMQSQISPDTWVAAFIKLRQLYAYLHRYQQTSAFVNSKAENMDRLGLAIRLMMSGCQVCTNGNKELKSREQLRSDWAELLQSIHAVESIDGEQLQDHALDTWLLELKLVSILRHRIEIAQEIFGSEDDELLEGDFRDISDAKKLPLQSLWNETLREIRQIDKTYSKFNCILQEPDISRKWWHLPWLLPTESETSQGTEAFSILDDQKDVVACIPQLSCLVVLLRNLKTKLLKSNGWRLVKRPHHTVQTTTDSNGHRVAVPTVAKQLLPEIPNQASSSFFVFGDGSTAPIALANLLERLGLAIDIAAYDCLGQSIPAAELHVAIENYVSDLPTCESSQLFAATIPTIWLPVENRGDKSFTSIGSVASFPESKTQPQSYGFLKLALIPRALSQLLTFSSLLQDRQIGANEAERQAIQDAVHLCFKGLIETFKHSLLTVVVRPRGEKRQTLSLRSGLATCFWTAPDLMRHRYQITVRGISRYEPLLRWAEPDQPSVQPSGTESALISHQITTERLWPPAISTESEDSPLLAPLVYPHSDSQRIAFSIFLPAEGQRSLLNHLSAVRTGWHGIETQWLWRNPWGITTDHRLFTSYCNYITSAQTLNGLTGFSSADSPLCSEPPSVSRPAEQLLRGERYLAAHNLPFCLEYDLLTRMVYESSAGAWSSRRSTWLRRLPSKPLPTQQFSHCLASNFAFQLLLPTELMTTEEITILNRFKHSYAEQQDAHNLWIGDIPDPEIVYSLYAKHPSSSGDDRYIFRLIDTILMPFANGRPPKPEDGSNPQPIKALSDQSLPWTLYRNEHLGSKYLLGVNSDCLRQQPALSSYPSDTKITLLVRAQYHGINSPLSAINSPL